MAKFIHLPIKDSKCKSKGCKRKYLIQGYCCYHYLKLLDEFEKKSRENKSKSKILYGN